MCGWGGSGQVGLLTPTPNPNPNPPNLSRPCMRFVAHRHCQDTLDKFFSGNYSGSNPTPYPLTLTPNPKPQSLPRPQA